MCLSVALCRARAKHSLACQLVPRLPAPRSPPPPLSVLVAWLPVCQLCQFSARFSTLCLLVERIFIIFAFFHHFFTSPRRGTVPAKRQEQQVWHATVFACLQLCANCNGSHNPRVVPSPVPICLRCPHAPIKALKSVL